MEASRQVTPTEQGDAGPKTDGAAPACPECGASITTAGSARVSEIVVCPECRNELEVVASEPVILAKAPEVEEDWGE